jgi:hypothetical protein
MEALRDASNPQLSLMDRLEGLRVANARTSSRGPTSGAIARAHTQEHNEDGDAENKGRRLDISLTSMFTNEVVGDVSRIHPTTTGRLRRAYTHFGTLVHERIQAEQRGDTPPARYDSTPAIQYAAKQKWDKYYPLIAICEDQKIRRRRATVPDLLCLLFDHTGQMSADVYKLIEFMAIHKGRHLSQQDVDEGITPKMASASFRALAKDRLATVNLSQWAKQLKASYMFPRDTWLADTRFDDINSIANDRGDVYNVE